MVKFDIEIWSNEDFDRHVKSKGYPTYENHNRHTYFKGFEFLGPNFVYDRPDTERGHEIPDFNPKDFDRQIVALDKSGIVGIFAFMYCKGDYDFWSYYPRFLEVREDKKRQGVATTLIRRLKEPCFMHGNILMIGRDSYTLDGNKYLKKIIERELDERYFRIVDGTFSKLEIYDLLKKKTPEEINSDEVLQNKVLETILIV
jgi:hypothetical protein